MPGALSDLPDDERAELAEVMSRVMAPPPRPCGCFCHLNGHKVVSGVENGPPCCSDREDVPIFPEWPPEDQLDDGNPPVTYAVPIVAEKEQTFRRTGRV